MEIQQSMAEESSLDNTLPLHLSVPTGDFFNTQACYRQVPAKELDFVGQFGVMFRL
jgi:hypothetical protein